MPTPSRSVLVIHGPNLNLLGEREPEVYGRTTLAQIDRRLQALAAQLGLVVECVQANGEGEIVDLVHSARGRHAALVINPAGYSHTSVAVHDALCAVAVPVVEVHLSNLYAREPMRHNSITGAAAQGVIMGLGPASYELALRYLAPILTASESESTIDV
jgi:3-dehydroquinate dehydratase-2